MKYTGDTTMKTQRNWVDSINDPTKWTVPASCAAYNSLAPNYSGGIVFRITPGGYQRGKWIGSKSYNWYTCDNWEDFVIPDSTTDVLIPSPVLPNNCRFMKDTTAYCRDLTIQGNALESDSALTSVLRVYGNFLMSGGTTNFALGGASVLHGSMYLKGNWNNYDENAFKEGNGNIIFNGSTSQNIFNSLGLEKFYNLAVNNSAGVNLGNNINIADSLVFNTGSIITSSNELYVSNVSVNAVSGHGINNCVVGNLRRQVNSAGIYDFPVGSYTDYELATVKLTSSTGLSNIITNFKNPSTGTVPNPALCSISGTAIGNIVGCR